MPNLCSEFCVSQIHILKFSRQRHFEGGYLGGDGVMVVDLLSGHSALRRKLLRWGYNIRNSVWEEVRVNFENAKLDTEMEMPGGRKESKVNGGGLS